MGPTRGSCSFRVSLNRTLHDSCLRARAGPRHGAIRVMLLPLPWAVAVCGSSWQVPAVPAPWVLSPVGAPAASTAGAGHWVPVCAQPCASSQLWGHAEIPSVRGKSKEGTKWGSLCWPRASAGRAPGVPRHGAWVSLLVRDQRLSHEQ